MMDCVKLRLKGEDLSEWSARVKNFECSFCKREFRSAQALGGHMNVHRRDRARLRLLPPNSIISRNSSEYSPYPNPNPNPNPNYSYFSSSSSLSGANCALSPFKLSPNSLGSSDHGNRKKLMIFDSSAGSHQQKQHNVPDFLPIPKKGNSSSSMRGRANLDYYDAGDRFKGFTTGFSQKHGHDSEDHLKAVRKDEKQINHLISRVDLDMEFLFKDPNHEEEEELDLELRLGHRSISS